jgi:hypothetical protein
MKTKPILMNGRLIRTLHERGKTQTRRICTSQDALDLLAGRPDGSAGDSGDISLGWGQIRGDDGRLKRPQWIAANADYSDEGALDIGVGYGQPGDLLWVREAWSDAAVEGNDPIVIYRADDGGAYGWHVTRWQSPIFMPRWASRWTLQLRDVRVERVQAISEEDAIAEGARRAKPTEDSTIEHRSGTYRAGFSALWDDINGAGAWDRNDWVWVLSFYAIQANVDDVLSWVTSAASPRRPRDHPCTLAWDTLTVDRS